MRIGAAVLAVALVMAGCKKKDAAAVDTSAMLPPHIRIAANGLKILCQPVEPCSMTTCRTAAATTGRRVTMQSESDDQLLGLDLLPTLEPRINHLGWQQPVRDDRVDVMMRMLPYLPLFVALSTSSPFWPWPGRFSLGGVPFCPHCSSFLPFMSYLMTRVPS